MGSSLEMLRVIRRGADVGARQSHLDVGLESVVVLKTLSDIIVNSRTFWPFDNPAVLRILLDVRMERRRLWRDDNKYRVTVYD